MSAARGTRRAVHRLLSPRTMGQLARGVSWGVDWSVESGVALRPPHSYEAPRDFAEEAPFEEDAEAEAPTLRPSGVTRKLPQVSPFVVGDPDDDDVPPTLRSPGLLQLVEAPPSTDDLIVAPPRRHASPIIVVDASPSVAPPASGEGVRRDAARGDAVRVDAGRVEVW